MPAAKKDEKRDAPRAGAAKRTGTAKKGATKKAAGVAAAPRELSRAELEALREKLRRKFHKR